MVTKFLPLPDNDGGKQRSLAMLERLAQLADVTLVAYDDGHGDVAGLRAMGVGVRAVPWRPSLLRSVAAMARARSATAGRFWSRAFADEVRNATAEQTDLLVVAYSQLAPFLLATPAARRLLDLHNVESELVASYGRSASPPARLLAMLESRMLRRLERRTILAADAVVVVSDRDRQRLPATPRTVLVCPNGWRRRQPVAMTTEPIAAFIALLGWAPNADAAVWLATEVWPGVIRRVPSARLLLVGRDPSPAVRALAGPSVEVTGTVPSVEPHLAAATVALAPLRAGGGSRLKILEALGAGRPVVATTTGAEGLEELVGEGVIVCDDAEAMAAVIADLLADPDAAAELGRRGHDAVVDRYAWDRTLVPLMDWVRS